MLKREHKSKKMAFNFRPSLIEQAHKIAYMKDYNFTEYLEHLMSDDIHNSVNLIEAYDTILAEKSIGR